MIGITIGVGRWTLAASCAAHAFRRHTGLQSIVLGNHEWEIFSDKYPYPGFLKVHVFDLVDSDDVLLFDADAVFINQWDPQQFAGMREVVAVVDRFIGDAASEGGVASSEYFNAGLIILNRRHHQEMLELARRFHENGERYALGEQPLLNKARRQCGIPLLALDYRFNHLRFYSDASFDPSETVVAHWTPHEPDPAPIEAFCQCSPVLSIKTAASAAEEFAATSREAPNELSGRGIVICAGGPKYLTCAWVLIRRLRELGCMLPIQVWHRGPQEVDDTWISLAAQYGVACVDAEKVRAEHPHPNLGGWELKPYAILHSPFREVLFLDADNVPVKDPTYLFDEPAYRTSGAIFWPDLEITRTPPDSLAWQVFGVPYRDEPEFESGQMLIEKSKCWRALSLCNWFNERSYFFYRYVYGDKDTFRFAWHKLGQPFAMPPSAKLVEPTFMQHDFQGKRIFQHRVQDKWSLFGNRVAPEFIGEDKCFAYLDELRTKWNPWATKISALASGATSRMAAVAGDAVIEQPGSAPIEVQFFENGIVLGGGRNACLWWYEGTELVLADEQGCEVTRLERKSPACWGGRTSAGSRSTMKVRFLRQQHAVPV